MQKTGDQYDRQSYPPYGETGADAGLSPGGGREAGGLRWNRRASLVPRGRYDLGQTRFGA